MDIFKKAKDHFNKFERLSKGKTKKELRELEETLLKPEVLPTYSGPPPSAKAKDPIIAQTLLVVFSSPAELKRLEPYFPISYVEQPSLLNNKLIMDLVEAFESGRISYNVKKRRFKFHSRKSRQENNSRISKMGTRKRRSTSNQ